jgi:hypothetical protein
MKVIKHLRGAITEPREYTEGKKIKAKDGFIALWTLVKYRFMD